MLTKEQEREIYEMYIDRKIKVDEIAEKYKIARGQVAQIAVKNGATPRREGTYGKSYKKGERFCPRCKKKFNVAGARYCCFCGADVRTSREIIVDGLKNVLTIAQLLPANVRDESVQTLLLAINELKK